MYRQRNFIRENLVAIVLVIAVTAVNGLTQQKEASIQSGREIAMTQDHSIDVGTHFGSVTIRGSEGDGIQARATTSHSMERVPVLITESRKKVITISLPKGVRRIGGPAGTINLELIVPRFARFEAIRSVADPVRISDIKGSVVIKTVSGDVALTNVGSMRVRTATGKIRLDAISGRVDLVTVGGSILGRDIQGDIRIVGINPTIELSCVIGAVEISDTNGQIRLVGIEGDVEVFTSSGSAHFFGEVIGGRRYRMKTMSGDVSMTIPEDSGFNALLTSYIGEISEEFSLSTDPLILGKTNKRLTGVRGNGRNQIELDSFDGRIRLNKAVSEALKQCREVKAMK